jgi:exonuclease SbcD
MAILIHTADIHLGAPLGWLGDKASEQREQLRRTLGSIVDLTLSERADCLIIAGDLFDSQSPPASDVRLAFQEFERLAAGSGASVIILPGSHDFLDPASVYSSYQKEFGRTGQIVVLGLDGRQSVELERVGISIRGTPLRSNRSSTHPLAGLTPDPGYPINIAVAHGSVNLAPIADDDHPIDTLELSSAAWSYIALGHWHSWRDVSQGPTPAIYPGAPEIIAVDQAGSGHVARVEIGPEGTQIEKTRVGERLVAEVEVDLTGAMGVTDVAERVRSRLPEDGRTIVRLALTGLVSVDAGFNQEALFEELAGDYFFVTPGARSYHLRMEDSELEALPERLVIGRFARLMRERYEEAATDDERQQIEDALQLGVALLQGKAVFG